MIAIARSGGTDAGATTRRPTVEHGGALASTRARERELAVNQWDDVAADWSAPNIHFRGYFGPRVRTFTGELSAPGIGVDHRIYLSTLLTDFLGRGGRVVYGGLRVTDLESVSETHDLAFDEMWCARTEARLWAYQSDLSSCDTGWRSDVAYYVIDVIDISNVADVADAMADYRAPVGATTERYGGRVVFAGPVRTLEGSIGATEGAVIEFVDELAATRWSDSPEYAELKRLRARPGPAHHLLMNGSAP